SCCFIGLTTAAGSFGGFKNGGAAKLNSSSNGSPLASRRVSGEVKTRLDEAQDRRLVGRRMRHVARAGVGHRDEGHADAEAIEGHLEAGRGEGGGGGTAAKGTRMPKRSKAHW